jgi:hypothetical protein
MNFFDHKDLGNHLLQLCPKVVKHPVCTSVSEEPTGFIFRAEEYPEDGGSKFLRNINRPPCLLDYTGPHIRLQYSSMVEWLINVIFLAERHGRSGG